LKYYKVMMVNDNIKDVRANAALPGNYYFRYFNEGDERIWAYIEAGAGEFKDEISAIQRFEDEFGKHIEELKKRCIFLCHEKDGPIGTAMAWYNLNFQGREYGRLHWVGIHPDHQGKNWQGHWLPRLWRDFENSMIKRILPPRLPVGRQLSFILILDLSPLW